MPAELVTAATPPDRSRCYIRNWIAFGEGYWKGKLYSRADCLEMGRLFQKLSTGKSPLLVPRVKLGHTSEQELAKWLEESQGFPSLGRIFRLDVAPDGLCGFWLEMPTQIGALVNGGWYVDGSIEIAPPLPDPENASRTLYPVLTAIALLGEEQPAVPLRYPMPRAVFADGTEVPAERDLTTLAKGMSEVARTFSARGSRTQPAGGRFSFQGRAYTTTAVCFSAMTPLPGKVTMTPEKKAALEAAGFTPEEIAKMEASLGAAMATVPPTDPPPPPAPPAANMSDPPKPGEDPIAAMSAKFAADASAPPYAKELMSAFAAFAADCNKRFSAAEAAVGDMQKLKPKAEMAAKFSLSWEAQQKAAHKAAVERVVDQAITEGRLEARDRDDKITVGLTKDNATTFSAGTANAGKTAFGAWRDELLSRKPSRFFADTLEQTSETHPGKPEDDPFVKKALASMPGNRQPAYAPVAK